MSVYVGPGGRLYRKVSCSHCGTPNGVPASPTSAAAPAVEVAPDLRCKCHRCGRDFEVTRASAVVAGNRRQRRAAASSPR